VHEMVGVRCGLFLSGVPALVLVRCCRVSGSCSVLSGLSSLLGSVRFWCHLSFFVWC